MNTESAGTGRRTILITGGRAPAALELARLFAAWGHRVVAADSVPVSLCSASRSVDRSYVCPKPRRDPRRYIDFLAEVVAAEQVDLLVPTCEEIFYIAWGKERLSPRCHVFADDLDKLAVLHNKRELIALAEKLGFCVPETRLLASQAEADRFLSERGADLPDSPDSPDSPVVLKPVYSRFAAKALVVRGRERPPLPGISASFPWVGQQYIAGRPYCTYSIARQGAVVAHACYAGAFTAGRGASISFEYEERADLLEWVRRFAAAVRFTGQIAFDFIVTAEGKAYPIECNPRATSGVHLFRPADRLERAFLGEGLGEGEVVQPSERRPSLLAAAMLAYGWRSGGECGETGGSGEEPGEAGGSGAGQPDRPKEQPGLSPRSGAAPGSRAAAVSRGKHRSRFRQWASLLRRGRDVVFRLDDPLPAAAQLALLWHFWRRSRSRRSSIAEAMTSDIEWNGEAWE